jgi:hypothetical protein
MNPEGLSAVQSVSIPDDDPCTLLTREALHAIDGSHDDGTLGKRKQKLFPIDHDHKDPGVGVHLLQRAHGELVDTGVFLQGVRPDDGIGVGVRSLAATRHE